MSLPTNQTSFGGWLVCLMFSKKMIPYTLCYRESEYRSVQANANKAVDAVRKRYDGIELGDYNGTKVIAFDASGMAFFGETPLPDCCKLQREAPTGLADVDVDDLVARMRAKKLRQ
jgi:hypothetical protein